MPNGLSQQPAELFTGEEEFQGLEGRLPLRLLDFWRWSGSMLADNTARGVLAEFLVAAALGLHVKEPRREWDECDIRTESDTPIEVKSAAYYQTWGQDRPSPIRFGIAAHPSWNAKTGEYKEETKRWADIYIFCVFTGKSSRDCLDISEWRFFVIPTRVLDEKVPQQKTIDLNPLRNLSPRECSFRDLKQVISDTEKEVKNGVISSS